VVDRINYRNEYSTFNTCDGFGISIGLLLGKVKIFGISLGTTWILFFGIFLGHIGLQVDENILHFLKEFGLILFIYSIGMQVGPSFFSSFKQGGITLNILASGVVLLGVLVTYIIHLVTGLPIATMVGILSGAVTNTPGLGAHSRPIPK
jgi:putative transport protein